MNHLTGPIPESVAADLRALKLRLAAMEAPDALPADQARQIGAEISAIRLHLKRLELERLALSQPVTPPAPAARGDALPPAL